MSTRKTSIYDSHVKHGGKVVEFAGWYLPVEFSGLINEHNSVRNNAGIFDVSHMGEVTVKGEKATEYVQHIIANDVKKLYDGKVLYTPMCYPHGGIVDDLLVYRVNKNEYLLVINAANTEKDYNWFVSNNKFGVEIKNVSDQYFQLAVQGPNAKTIMEKCFKTDLSDIKFFHFKKMPLNGIPCIVSRTGYTGENGFEIYGLWNDGAKLFDALIAAGVVPCGLGCRDTLRLEAALMLYGNDINQETTPLEAGIDIFVKLDSDDFIGKSALIKQKQEGLKRRLIGFTLEGRGIPRHDYLVVDAKDNTIGVVTSGTLSPSLGIPIGLAYVQTSRLNDGSPLYVQIRKNKIMMKQMKLPFLKKY
ncbi:MAG: glycine cleavage system aminomethyltransferase GcvT [Proteobacteria bacterium]|nr:glycine cleavage system aminomethyltransferase GcvT [Pseudomonadota bacterium]